MGFWDAKSKHIKQGTEKITPTSGIITNSRHENCCRNFCGNTPKITHYFYFLVGALIKLSWN